ncbi:hypothetical protein [Pseudomonas grimontii]|uniref:hypothetical protein n=1 Tax=Pseudomonas grimontii TaxID=129847 RepID=UPI00387B25A2|nr:hypothetical protein [Pseudomonas grimontii]
MQIPVATSRLPKAVPGFTERRPNANRTLQSLTFTEAQESQWRVPTTERESPQGVVRQWLREPSEDLQLSGYLRDYLHGQLLTQL